MIFYLNKKLNFKFLIQRHPKKKKTLYQILLKYCSKTSSNIVHNIYVITNFHNKYSRSKFILSINFYHELGLLLYIHYYCWESQIIMIIYLWKIINRVTDSWGSHWERVRVRELRTNLPRLLHFSLSVPAKTETWAINKARSCGVHVSRVEWTPPVREQQEEQNRTQWERERAVSSL